MTWCCWWFRGRKIVLTNRLLPVFLSYSCIYCLIKGLHYDLFSYYVGIAWLFSIRLLCRRIELACCMAIVFISLNVCFTKFLGSLKVCYSCFIDGVCVVPLAPAVMIISGSIFHPCWVMSLISGWYFWILLLIVSSGNLSFVYVNSINCIMRLSHYLFTF